MNKCYVIAEAGLNHNGSINIAKELIDVAFEAGADAVKFQKRSVHKLASIEQLEKKDNRFPSFGNTYRKIRDYLEFDFEQYKILKDYSKSKNLDFIVTAFDEEAYDFLKSLGINKFKFASHSLTNLNLLNYAAKNKIESIISTGMCDIDEIDTAVNIFKKNNCPLSIMHCVSSYPTPNEDCNLSFIKVLKDRYGLKTGYSGHEIGYLPTLVSVSMGAEIIERHFTLDKKMEGFDHKISLEPAELISMIKEIRKIKLILGNGNKFVSNTEMITRNKYHVSMVAIKQINKGELLTNDLFEYRNPGTGIPPKDENKYIGKKTNRTIMSGSLIMPDMLG
tara:strand:+ start:628 stop:1632 length:1005 start_codon:yes stop_codon:yes gene_type:complete